MEPPESITDPQDYKKAIRRAKRTAWQTFFSDIEKSTDAERLRKILSKTAAPLGYLQKVHNQTPV